MAKWSKKELRLKEHHGWHAKPGYQIFVADRGAVRFDFPRNWTVAPGPDSIRFTDRPPPDDQCLLQLSVIRLPLGIDWTELPLTALVEEAIKEDGRRTVSRGEVVYAKRRNLELAWIETRFIDETERREACSHLCLARGADVQPLITLDFWPEDAKWVVPVWDEVLRSLRLGEYVASPTVGPGQ